MESAWLAAAAGGRPFAVVRVVADPAGRRLADPRIVPEGIRALRSLRRTRGALDEWARSLASLSALGPIEVMENDGISENVHFGLPAELKGSNGDGRSTQTEL
jgi:4-hydroxy-3-methylbut-2-enyl diphosphate reductase